MPYKCGAPKGNLNRLKHGRYRGAALAQRKLVRETIRSARAVLLQARIECFGQIAPESQPWTKVRNFTTLFP